MKFNYRTIQISMKKYINILILYFILSHCIGCNKDKISDLKKDFPTMELITAIDSIDLESKGLLLPFNVRSFDSCFVFSNIRTKNNVTILIDTTRKSKISSIQEKDLMKFFNTFLFKIIRMSFYLQTE